MNMGKFLIANLIGTAFVALLGLMVGALWGWILGFFLPESAKPVITGIVFVLFMLGVPRIWKSNWDRMNAQRFLQRSRPSCIDASKEPQCQHADTRVEQWSAQDEQRRMG